MKNLLLWAVALVLASSIGYSAVLANREKQPPTSAGPSAACQVTSYSLTSSGSAVSTMVVCKESGRYRVSVRVSAPETVASGDVTVNLSQDLPAMVTISVSPTFPPEIQSYKVSVSVDKV